MAWSGGRRGVGWLRRGGRHAAVAARNGLFYGLSTKNQGTNTTWNIFGQNFPVSQKVFDTGS